MTAETSNARGDVVAERQAWYEQQIALAEGQWAAAFLDRWECGDDVPSKEHYVALWLAERAAPPPVSVPLDGLTALDGLVDRIAEAIRDGAGLAEGDPPWERLGEERRAPWRADAKRALSVVKESLTAAGILAARTSQTPDAEVRALPAKWRDRAANNPGSFAAAANVVCANELEAALAAAQQGQAVAECHCATCTCAPGMTPAVRFDTSPAAQEGAIRDHLIALGWTPPNTAPPPSAPVGVEAIAAEIRASLGRGATVCTRRRWAIELEALAQQTAAVDEAAAIRAFEEHFQASSDDPYFEGELELWLTAWRKALAAQQQGGAE